MKSSYIGYSIIPEVRFEATSGGIGSTLLKYLFDNNFIQTALTLDFNKMSLKYKPRLIYSFKDYQITGSIYHEINIIEFIKNNNSSIKGRLFLFLLPCQVQPIKRILSKIGIETFIVALTCSSQQSIDATFYLLKRLKISKNNVERIKYRGSGWPGGIQINLKEDTSRFIPNNNSIWTKIFHSRLFIQKRCFRCNETISINSDITLADPWLKEYIQTEKIGQSLIAVNTIEGETWLRRAEQDKMIYIKPINPEDIQNSQLYTIIRKQKYLNNKRKIGLLMRLINTSLYKKITLNFVFFFNLHCILLVSFERRLK